MFKQYKDFNFFGLQLLYIIDFGFYILLAIFIQNYKHSGLSLFEYLRTLVCVGFKKLKYEDKMKVHNVSSEMITTIASEDISNSDIKGNFSLNILKLIFF